MKKKLLNKTAVLTLTAITATTGMGTMYYVYNQNVVAKQDNGYYSMTGEDKGSFDKEKTPISNMLILLKILNNSAQCDGEWYQELEKCIEMLDAQYNCNKDSKDNDISELMKLQCRLVKCLKEMQSQLCADNIDAVQKAYNEYHDYYYEIIKGGNTNEIEQNTAS